MEEKAGPYLKSRIYFMSGTGNSFRLASWIHEACTEAGLGSRILSIDKARPREEIDASSRTLLTLVFPTHGFLPPWSMIKFLFKLPVRRGTRVFWAPTRGSFRLGRALVPGAAGLASFLPALVLLFKGYRVMGMMSFDMPANMISIHSSLKDQTVRWIKRRARDKLNRYLPRVLSGKTFFWTRNNLYELIWTVPLLRFWPLFPVLYLILGRFYMGQMMFANHECAGCGLCARSCPNRALVLKGRRRPRPYWKYNCEACLRCMNYCPERAIEVGHSWGIILYFVSLFPFSVTLFDLAARLLPFLEPARSWSTEALFNAVYYYPAILAAYLLFFVLIGWKPMNRLFTWTTFTRLFRRYHDPETRLVDLTGDVPGGE